MTSANNAGDLSSIPGSGRSTGEGIGYPFQYSWVSLVAQLVKNLSAMQETWIWFLGQEDPLEKGMVTHSSTLAWRIPWTEEPGELSLWGHEESDIAEQLTLYCLVSIHCRHCIKHFVRTTLCNSNSYPIKGELQMEIVKLAQYKSLI